MNLEDRVRKLEKKMKLVRDGSIVEHISEAIHWKATSVRLTGGTDYTVDATWTDLDLTAHTSANAKYVFLILIHGGAATAGDVLMVRKNGDTPSHQQMITCQVAGVNMFGFVICAMDTDQKIEYYATDASDTLIDILGYLE